MKQFYFNKVQKKIKRKKWGERDSDLNGWCWFCDTEMKIPTRECLRLKGPREAWLWYTFITQWDCHLKKKAAPLMIPWLCMLQSACLTAISQTSINFESMEKKIPAGTLLEIQEGLNSYCSNSSLILQNGGLWGYYTITSHRWSHCQCSKKPGTSSCILCLRLIAGRSPWNTANYRQRDLRAPISHLQNR